MNKPIRILHIIGGMYYGGKESLIMNVYKRIDRTKIQFDFIVHSDIEKNLPYIKQIERFGGRVFYVRKISEIGVLKYINVIKNIIINNGPFYAVHSHMNHQAGLNLLSARLAGVENRISHVHSTDVGSRKNRLLLPIYRLLIKFNSKKRVACSVKAGEYYYQKNENFIIINNGIDIDKFVNNNDQNSKILMKKKLGIDKNTKILGHIGRFIPVKNHEFLIKVFKEVLKYDDFRLLLVGDGPEITKIKKMCSELNIQNKVHLLGEVNDIPSVIGTFDFFLFPSFNEGLGTVLIEAQASGIPCIASNTLPKDSDLGLGLIKYCSINSIDEWVKYITSSINDYNNVDKLEIERVLKEKGFDCETTVKSFLKLYEII